MGSHLKSNTEKLIPLYNYAVLHAEQDFSDLAELKQAVNDTVVAISQGVEELDDRARGCWASLFGCCRGSAKNAEERAPLMPSEREKLHDAIRAKHNIASPSPKGSVGSIN